MTAYRKPRLSCPQCGAQFVLEKSGDPLKAEDATPPEEPSGPKMIELRSQDWFENFWAYYVAGNLDQCRKMIALAKTAEVWPFDPAKAPNFDAIKGMNKIDITTAAWSAWRKHLEGQGLRFDLSMLPAWVWVPSEWPLSAKTEKAG